MTNHPIEGVAFVTGGGGGIGGETAVHLAAAGVAIAVADIDAKLAATTARRIEDVGGEALALTLDVTDSRAVDAVVKETEAALGPIGYLVNTAGTFDWTNAEDVSDQAMADMLAVHIGGTHACCRAVLPGMTARGGGAIVNTTSIHAIRGQARTVHYSAAKGAILAYTKSLAREKAQDGIRVNAVAPGPIDTPLWRGEMSEEDAESKMRERSAVIPVGRLGTAEEVASAIAYLLSPAASYLTGHILTVDGGDTMN